MKFSRRSNETRTMAINLDRIRNCANAFHYPRNLGLMNPKTDSMSFSYAHSTHWYALLLFNLGAIPEEFLFDLVLSLCMISWLMRMLFEINRPLVKALLLLSNNGIHNRLQPGSKDFGDNFIKKHYRVLSAADRP